jgi:hypothetical protein
MKLLPDGIRNVHLLPLLLVALLPLLLHLLDRRRARSVSWPAMRFLIPRSRARLRRLRLREALLILVRSLAALLIAWAILQPVSRETRTVLRDAPGGRAVAIALDTSWSMAYRAEPSGPSAIEKAREGILAILEDLAPGSPAILIAAGTGEGAGGAAAVPAPTLDLEAVRRAARGIRPGGGRFDILDALEAAARSLAMTPAPALEIHVFTDLQASAFPDRGADRLRLVSERLRSLRPAPSIHVVDCGSPAPWNRFVSHLDPGALAVTAGEVASFRATVEVSGSPPPGEPTAVPLRLSAGEEEIAVEAAVSPAAPTEVVIPHRLAAGGETRVSASLPADGLVEDDARRLVLDVPERIRILLVGTALEGDGAGSARYADLALAPRAPAVSAPDVVFRPEFREAPEDLAGHEVVIITGLRRLEPDAAARLERFVAAGGGLLVFAGAETDIGSLSDLLHREGRGILPARLAGRAAAPEGVHPREVATAHPALAVFRDPEEGDLARVTARSFARAVEIAPGASVLAGFSAELPWIIEKASGRGKVILVTTSATPADSDLPLTPLFLPLLHRLARHLAAPDPSARSVLAGETISLVVEPELAGGEAYAIGPSGARLPARIALEGGEVRVVVEETGTPGFHEVRVAGEGGEERLSRVLAVNIEPAESRLDRVAAEPLAEIQSVLGLEVTRDARAASRRLVTTEVEVEHWPAAVALAIALLFIELALARGFARGRAPWQPEKRG